MPAFQPLRSKSLVSRTILPGSVQTSSCMVRTKSIRTCATRRGVKRAVNDRGSGMICWMGQMHWSSTVTYCWTCCIACMCEWNLSRIRGQSSSLWLPWSLLVWIVNVIGCKTKKYTIWSTHLFEFEISLRFWKHFRRYQAGWGNFHRGLTLPCRARFLIWMLWYYDLLHWASPK